MADGRWPKPRKNDMAPKTNKNPESRIQSESAIASGRLGTPEGVEASRPSNGSEPEAKTLYSRAEKSELIANWQLAGDKVKLVEKQLEEAKTEKSDAAFELQKAFGENKFSVAGILMRVVKKTNKTTKESGYFVREISLKADEEF